MVKKISAALALAAALIVPSISHAIVITLDDADQTVQRPTSGTVEVVYTGTITLTPGYELSVGIADAIYNAAGDLISGIFPELKFGVNGIMFTLVADATDLGLYAFNYTLTNPAQIGYSECLIGGGPCNNAFLNVSLNVVDSQRVPEPMTLALLAPAVLALAGLRGRRRRPTAA